MKLISICILLFTVSSWSVFGVKWASLQFENGYLNIDTTKTCNVDTSYVNCSLEKGHAYYSTLDTDYAVFSNPRIAEIQVYGWIPDSLATSFVFRHDIKEVLRFEFMKWQEWGILKMTKDSAQNLINRVVDEYFVVGCRMYVEPSAIPNCCVVTMGPQIEAGTVPGMPTQGMIAVANAEEEQGSDNVSLTITFDRATAMIHDEIDFVSLEHPLAQGVIDFETGLSHGAVACNIWQNSGMRGLMMQYNFLVELPVLEEWGVADIAGPRYVSVVIDAKGEDHSDLVESLHCGQFKDVGVPQGQSRC